MNASFNTDYKNIVSLSDLHISGCSDRREAGLPLGNGKMGSLLWLTPNSIRFQVNRDDVYANGCGTNSFHGIDSDYGSGCGFVDIDFSDFGDDVFTEADTRQHLDIYNGYATIKGKDIDVSAFICSDNDLLVVEVNDRRNNPSPIRASLRVLRFVSQYDHGKRPYRYPGGIDDDSISIVRTKDHVAKSKLSLADGCAVLTQEFTEQGFYCASAVAVSVAGRSSKTKRTNETEYSVTAKSGKGDFLILISSAASFRTDNAIETDAVHLIESAAEKGFVQLLETQQQWWNSFWSGSYIRLHSEDGDADLISVHCNYFMYVMACVSRGDYMPRYGGLLWYTGGDFRTWGAQQWWYNASCYYCAIPATGHFELLEPLYAQYFNNYASYARAAKQQWGSKGIYIPETSWFDGLEDLPETIAAEMRELYLARKPWAKRSRRFREFAKNKNMFESRWNWHLGTFYHRYGINTAPFSYVNHIFSATAKIAFLFWQKYSYTLDLSWLKERAYPMLKGVAEFYVNFPNAIREADGKIHLHHVNNHEAHWNCRDSIDEMTAVHGILPVAIRASVILGVDADLSESWKAFLRDLAPLPLNTHPDAIEPIEDGQPVMFTGALKPKVVGSDGHYHTDCPLQHFDLITLETEDAEIREIARNSYLRNYREHLTDDGVFTWNLDTESIAAARIGHTEGVRLLVPAQIKLTRQEKGFEDILGSGMPHHLANRLTLREGPEAIDAQRLGRSYLAIQNALCLCTPPSPDDDPVIRLFAAWPRQWDAEFKLAVPRGFIVTSIMEKGEITFVEIASGKGQECLIHNPWLGSEVLLIRDGTCSERLDGEIMRFNTQVDEKVVLQKE